MRFQVKYTKIGNHFFFISNLTEWHFSCEKEYNRLWLKETGLLTNEEKEILKRFGRILEKYGFAKKKGEITWLGAPFITSSERGVWQRVEKWISKKEYKEVERAFGISKPRFERIWKRESLKLKETKKFLSKKLTSKKFQSALLDLANFYDRKLPKKKIINIYLFGIPKESSIIGGGAVLREKGVTLEIRDFEPKTIDEYLLVIIHEIGHTFLERFAQEKVREAIKTYKLSSNNLVRERGQTGIIGELILSSLIPDGYLAEKYFNLPVRKKATRYLQIPKKKVSFSEKWRFLEKYIVFHLYPLAKEYIEKKQPIDENYIKETIEFTKKFFVKIERGGA